MFFFGGGAKNIFTDLWGPDMKMLGKKHWSKECQTARVFSGHSGTPFGVERWTWFLLGDRFLAVLGDSITATRTTHCHVWNDWTHILYMGGGQLSSEC